MRRAISVLLCVCLFLCVSVGLYLTYHHTPAANSGSTVKITVGSGHGSGVHIGSGYIITAAHVVDGAQSVGVKFWNPTLETEAEVIWSNAAHDVALLRVGLRGMPSSRLLCEDLSIGQPVEAVGNPGPLEFVHSYGRISSDIQERARWKRSIIASLAIAPGSSGGPVFDTHGRVVGIVVGVALTNIGGFSPSAVALAYLVPSSAICTLMARRA